MRSLRATRAAAQLLHRPPGATPASIVERLLALQSQDIIQARRALRARGAGFTAADVDAALVEERSVVIAWLNRGTLHMAGRDDYRWLLPLTGAPQFTRTWTRLAQEGVSRSQAERAVQAMQRALADRGPLTRAALREKVAALGIRVERQAFVHQLILAALRGLLVVGPLVDGKPGAALTRDWLGCEPPGPLEGAARERALGELARRYLVAHGPATARDLAWWAGLPLRDARAGLATIAGRLAQRDGDLVDLAEPQRPAAPARIPPRLLPLWDAYLLGWKQREFLVADRHVGRLYAEGMIGPAVTVDGLAVGTWKATRRAGRLAVEVQPFGRVGKRQLEVERSDLARFEGLELA